MKSLAGGALFGSVGRGVGRGGVVLVLVVAEALEHTVAVGERNATLATLLVAFAAHAHAQLTHACVGLAARGGSAAAAAVAIVVVVVV